MGSGMCKPEVQGAGRSVLSCMLGGVRLPVFKVMSLVETTYHKNVGEKKDPKMEPSGPRTSGVWRELVRW